MRPILLAVAYIALSVNIAFAQPDDDGDEKFERLESAKIAFLTRELSLTPDEAQKFWPIFNEFAEKRKALKKQERANQETVRANFASLTDRELELALGKALEFEQKEVDLKKEYVNKFKTVLPVAKVVRLYGAEEKFKREVLREMRNRQGATGGDGRGRR